MRWLRLPDLNKKTGLSKTAIYMLVKEQGFPPPRKVPGLRNVSVWIETEVEAWMVNAVAAGSSSTVALPLRR